MSKEKLPEVLVLTLPYTAGDEVSTELSQEQRNSYQMHLADSLADGIRGQGGRAVVDKPVARVVTDATAAQIGWALRYRGREWLWDVYRGSADDRRLLAKEAKR